MAEEENNRHYRHKWLAPLESSAKEAVQPNARQAGIRLWIKSRIATRALNTRNRETMIYDKLDNISLYKGLSTDIYEGLMFLNASTKGLGDGVYVINPRVKAIVSEYTTKEVNEYGYEAHRENIDIQYLIKGDERIKCLPLDYLKEVKAYNEDNDVAFYEEVCIKPQELTLGNGFFAILFPQDGHMPQLCVNDPGSVKKIVVKVKFKRKVENPMSSHRVNKG